MSKLTISALCGAFIGGLVLSTASVSAAPAASAGLSAPSGMVSEAKMSKKKKMMMMKKKKMMMNKSM